MEKLIINKIDKREIRSKPISTRVSTNTYEKLNDISNKSNRTNCELINLLVEWAIERVEVSED